MNDIDHGFDPTSLSLAVGCDDRKILADWLDEQGREGEADAMRSPLVCVRITERGGDPNPEINARIPGRWVACADGWGMDAEAGTARGVFGAGVEHGGFPDGTRIRRAVDSTWVFEGPDGPHFAQGFVDVDALADALSD